MDIYLSVLFLLFLIGVYFIPTIVAVERNVVNKWSVAVINGFLGWTLIGWVVSLAMAMRTQTLPKPQWEQGQIFPPAGDQGRYSAK